MKCLYTLLWFAAFTLVNGQDEKGAEWMPSPHFTRGRRGQVKYLIIHGTAGGSSAQNIGTWFQNPEAQASTHYTVDQSGVVVQSVRERDTAWGNGRLEKGHDKWWTTNPNPLTISIEHVKRSKDNSDQLTEAQKRASFRLIKNILARNPGIKPKWADSTGGITGHYSISPQSKKTCPGPFPWSEMFAAIGNSGRSVTRAGPNCFGTVTTTSVNVRSQPNSKSNIVSKVYIGQPITITGRVNGEVVYGNRGWFKIPQGYISAYFINLRYPKPSWCYK